MPPVASDFWEAVEALFDEGTNGIASRRALATRLHELDQRHVGMRRDGVEGDQALQHLERRHHLGGHDSLAVVAARPCLAAWAAR